MRRRSIAIHVCVVIVTGSACGAPTTGDRVHPRPADRAVSVIEVDDVATVRFRIDGREAEVRLIGVDVAFARRLGCQTGDGEVVARLLSTGSLRVEFEGRAVEAGRPRPVWVWTGTRLVNAAVLRAGAATLARYWPAQRHEAEVQRAQLAAARAGRGLWSRCPALHGAPASDGSGRRCDPSYTGACVAPYPPDLDCEQIRYANLKIDGPDLHDLDGDGDGLGCERFNPM